MTPLNSAGLTIIQHITFKVLTLFFRTLLHKPASTYSGVFKPFFSILVLFCSTIAAASPSENLDDYIDETWPKPGYLVYLPETVTSEGSWRPEYDAGLESLRQGQLQTAAAHFVQADEKASNPSDLQAKVLCRFSAGTSYLLANQDEDAVWYLRRAIGALHENYKNSVLNDWYDTTVGNGNLHSYHIWQNLIVAYLLAKPTPGDKIGSPWERKNKKNQNELERDPGYFEKNTDNPHSSFVQKHQKNQSDPIHLVFANSNLDRIYEDRSNFINSFLLSYSSAIVLVELGDLGKIKNLLDLLDGKPNELLPVSSIDHPNVTLDATQIKAHVATFTFYKALLADDINTATDLLTRLTERKEDAERALLAVQAETAFQQALGNPADQSQHEQAMQLAKQVLKEPDFKFLHNDAQNVLQRYQILPSSVVPAYENALNWLQNYWGWIFFLVILLVMIALIAPRWRRWNNNVYYWRMLNHCSREPDIINRHHSYQIINRDYERPDETV